MSSERKIKEAAQLLHDDANAKEPEEKPQVIFVVRHQPRGNLSPAIEKMMTLLRL